MNNVICLKWGTLYSAEYVNRLYRGVKAHLSRPFRFVCVTDDPRGLVDGVETAPIPPKPEGMVFQGWYDKWPNIYIKLCLFERGLANLEGPTLFLDIDQVIVGDLDFIRATAIEIDKGKNRKKYTFEHDRDHFYYKNITDGGFPTGGCLDFDFMPEGELISPYMFIGKNECKTVELDACFEGVVEGEIVCNIYKGIDEKSHGVTEPKALPFKLVGNGKRATFNIDISEIDESFVGFLLRFANSGHLKVYGVEIK